MSFSPKAPSHAPRYSFTEAHRQKLEKVLASYDGPALLELAQEMAQMLSQQDLSKTQLRAAYSAARRLDRATGDEVRQSLMLVMTRLAYLVERSYQASQRGSMPRANYESLNVLHKMMQHAARFVLAENTERDQRAARLLELFQSILAYQGLARTFQAGVLRPMEAAEHQEMEQVIAGEGLVTFKLAQKIAGQSERLDLSRSQLRNIYTILKTIEAAPLDQKNNMTAQNSWKLRLLEPRMLYVLSREAGLEMVVRALRNGLVVLYANGTPTKAGLANYARLAEALVGLQTYERYQARQDKRPNARPGSGQDLDKLLADLAPAIRQDDGKALNELARKTARLMVEADLSRGQSRNLYDTIEELAARKFDQAALNELQGIRATLRYAYAREPKLQALVLVLEAGLDLIFEQDADSQKRAEWLADFFEAVLAWQTVWQYQKKHPASDSEMEPIEARALKEILNGKTEYTATLAEWVAERVSISEDESLNLSGGQLRTVFAMLRQEALAAHSGGAAEQVRLRRRLGVILPRLAYAAARSPGVAPIEMIARAGLEKILEQPETRLDPLVDLLEGIVAFYYVNKE
jgi:CRISPR/Cas system CSM-associated protein Csm2 small subunit